MKPERLGRNGSWSLAGHSRRQSLRIWAVRISSMSKQNGCLPLCMSPDTFHLTKALTQAHTRTQAFSLNGCASVAFFELFTDPDSTTPQHKPCALWITIAFPLAAPDGPHTYNVETAGKVGKQPVEFVTLSSQWLELRDGTLWWLYHHDELIFRRCVMPYGVQNEDITHTHTQAVHIMLT